MSQIGAAPPRAGSLVIRVLERHGVTCVFGMADPVDVFHAIDPSRMRNITVRDEKHGAIMAHGYAQATGRVGVCAATVGPGASNLVTGLLEAERSSVPVIALVQDHPQALRGRNAASELDHAAALGPFVKAVLRIDHPEQTTARIERAIALARGGRPGPVAVLCPTDVMGAEVSAEMVADATTAQDADGAVARPCATPDAIAAAADALAAARRPMIIAGGGAQIAGAGGAVIALGERWHAPIATTLTGRGLIPDAHPLAAGPIGSATGGQLGCGQVANRMLAEADMVLLVGSRTGQIAYSGWSLPRAGTTVVHVDIDAAEIGRNFATTVGLVGDARATLEALVQHCEANGLAGADHGAAARLATLRETWRARIAPYAGSNATPLRPERVTAALDRIVDDTTLVVTDASFATGWGLGQLHAPGSGRYFLSPRGTGGIGWSLPAAIGAKLGDPSRNVLCITGDGAFGYVMNELETAARCQVPVLVVVFNNATLAFQKHWELQLRGSYRESDLLDVNYAELAKVLHGDGERVHDAGDLDAALARGRQARVPYVIDVVVDPEAIGPVAGLDGPDPMADGA